MNFLKNVVFFLGGSDFDVVNARLVFESGSGNGTRMYFDLSIIDDAMFEKDEYFTLHLVAANDGVVFHIAYLSVHIHDNDRESTEQAAS